MKKLLLAGCILLSAAASYAQFTFSPNTTSATGVTFEAGTSYSDGITPQGCNNFMPEPTTTAPGMMYVFQDYNAGGVYSAGTCTGTALSVGVGVGPGNGGSFAVPGSVGFGLNIASGYTTASWATICVAVNPSFGFNFATTCPSAGNGWNALATGQNPISVDLSTIASTNKKLYINYLGQAGSGTPTFNTRLQLFRDPANDNGAGAFNAVEADQPSANFILDGASHQLVIDFSGTTVNDATILAAVRQISFIYYGTTVTNDYKLKILGFSIGTATPLALPTTAVKNASTLVSSTKLYPNPVSDMATVELELKVPAQVKVSLSDMLGKEVLTIAEGTMNSVNESFSVASLQKGIYTVNYTVDGSPAKSSLLMVK